MVESIRIETNPAIVTSRLDSSVDLLQAVADPVRWAILNHLTDGTRCVCDLQSHVPIAANLLSYHLKVLRDAGLVTTARRGRWVDYTLASDAYDRLTAALPAAPATTADPTATADLATTAEPSVVATSR